MKKVAGSLKIDQAQYQELAAFTKFGGDMDAVTMMTIDKGQKNEQLLIQPVHTPMSVEHQIAILYCGTHGLLKKIPLLEVHRFEKEFLATMELKHRDDLLNRLKEGIMNDAMGKIIERVATDTIESMQY
jgi:F-type H+-transporting ATPase subunit alpha